MNNRLNVPTTQLKRIVVIGGGFAGLNFVKELDTTNFQVVVLDQNNYHTFIPLLYQTATNALAPSSIAYPLRKILRKKKNVFFRMVSVSEVSPPDQTLQTSEGEISYDFLIIATGTKVAFFGNDDIEKYSFTLKSVNDAIALRENVLRRLETAERTEDPVTQKKLMRFCIAGGGPTGVELAGALAELKLKVFKKDYPSLNLDQMEVHLFDGGDRLLAGMSEHAGEKAQESLEDLGVIMHLNCEVSSYDGETMITSKDEHFDTYTLIWAAGVEGSVLKGFHENAVSKTGRLKVDSFSKVAEHNFIYAIGDIALMKTEDYPEGHPQVAQPAIQQGKHLAKNLKRLSQHKDLKAFAYFDKGSMAVIGRNRAVADIKKLKFSGFPAWLLWSGIHLFFLVGHRNRIIVFFNWIYNYFNFDRAARLIIRDK